MQFTTAVKKGPIKLLTTKHMLFNLNYYIRCTISEFSKKLGSFALPSQYLAIFKDALKHSSFFLKSHPLKVETADPTDRFTI